MLNQSVPVVFGFSRSHCVAHMPYFFPTALVAGFLEESWAIFALCPPIGLSSTFQLLTVMWYWLSFSVVFFFSVSVFVDAVVCVGQHFFLCPLKALSVCCHLLSLSLAQNAVERIHWFTYSRLPNLWSFCMSVKTKRGKSTKCIPVSRGVLTFFTFSFICFTGYVCLKALNTCISLGNQFVFSTCLLFRQIQGATWRICTCWKRISPQRADITADITNEGPTPEF